VIARSPAVSKAHAHGGRLGIRPGVPKQTQLRIFMNRAHVGSSNGVEVLGSQAAAKAYFGRDLQNLSEREYMALVCMLVAPSTYHVVLQPDASAKRVEKFEQLVSMACPECCVGVPPGAPCGSVSQ
jgi:monofunctional biosynthetic peptidoglycan transglycosylase